MKKLTRNKKGLELNSLYSFVLLIVMVGMVIGIGMITLTRFADTADLGATAKAAVNTTATQVGSIGITWLPLIITIVILAIIMTLVITSFSGSKR